jgi:LPXTG-site transpeptidase (sortase) family protein
VIQPLFPQDDDETKRSQQDDSYLLKHRHARRLQPVSQDLIAPHTKAHPTPSASQSASPDSDVAAIELIRRKVQALYTEEPDAVQEEAVTERQPASQPMSRHQQFMHDLSTSGKSLAHIQTAWHNYYVALPDDEKHAVWQEFYSANSQQPTAYTNYAAQQAVQSQPVILTQPAFPKLHTEHAKEAPATAVVSEHEVPATTLTHQEDTKPHKARKRRERQTTAGIKKKVLQTVNSDSKRAVKAREHLRSLVFGLASGALTLLIFFFGFFNEVIIAPFIQPSRHVSATPIIVDSDSVAPSDTPEVIIPKINVQIPVVYDVASMAEKDIQAGLENGVVHYPTTVQPGQQGNAAFFGHSSNNIFNKGQYKFAFVLLRQLVPGDIFYITYDKKVYSYRVFDKKVVTPAEVSVLNPVEGKPVTATLITCDPPGTSTNRLVVWGEQISPDPSGASAPTNVPAASTDGTAPAALPSEGPKLWNRIWDAIF